MGVHMFRCYIGRGPMSVSDLETRIQDWVASNAEWAEDNASHTLSTRNTELYGSGESYHAVDVRFLRDYSKANLLQKFVDKLQDKVGWYRVGYHECGHDGSGSQDCTFTDTTQWTAKNTSIPSGVPNFQGVTT